MLLQAKPALVKAMPERPVMVEVRRLKKYFPIRRGIVFARKIGDIKAVDDVTFEIHKGETLGLVGESGSGKTTVGRALLRLLESDAGEIILDGEDFRRLKGKQLRRARRRTQMIFQDPYASLNPRIPVHGIISEPLEVAGGHSRKELRARVDELLDMVGLDSSIRNRYPHEFSGGQRQRVGIARALALNPEFIVCDEAIASLDVSIQAQIVNLLEDLQHRFNITYLFIAHDLSMVRHISDHIAVMYLGKIMELAGRDEIFDDPQHPYTQALISAVPVPDPEVEESRERIVLEGDIPSPANPPPGCVFSTRCRMAMEICSQKAPDYRKIEIGHYAACHHAAGAA
ncbi:MAG: ATP-binding cassette domain-containing protein [Alphaproteobacteria bacterium]|jgi:oligopeptide transport system ATP-binding protein|nr:ATP-binding cassette domain-containing protein [Alphaproteobacteria bacterium]